MARKLALTNESLAEICAFCVAESAVVEAQKLYSAIKKNVP